MAQGFHVVLGHQSGLYGCPPGDRKGLRVLDAVDLQDRQGPELEEILLFELPEHLGSHNDIFVLHIAEQKG